MVQRRRAPGCNGFGHTGAAALIAAVLALAGCTNDPAEPAAARAPATTAPAQGGLLTVGDWRTPDGRYARTMLIGGRELAIEVSDWPLGTAPTPELKAAADAFVGEARAANAHLVTEADVLAAGYVPWEQLGHLVNVAYVEDGAVLDPARPEMIMLDREGKVAALMFLAADNTAKGPQIGGPATVWHFHPWPDGREQCMYPHGLLPYYPADGVCPEGFLMTDRTPEMIHVWMREHPDGPFATDMAVIDHGH